MSVRGVGVEVGEESGGRAFVAVGVILAAVPGIVSKSALYSFKTFLWSSLVKSLRELITEIRTQPKWI